MNAKNKNYLLLFLIVLGGLIAFNVMNSNQGTANKISYSDFITAVKDERVVNVSIQNEVITGNFLNGGNFETIAPQDSGLIALLNEYKVNVNIVPPNQTWYITLLLNWGPFILLIALWVFFMRNMQGGGSRLFSLGRSRMKRFNPENQKVTFKDVAGVDESKAELAEVVDYLRNPDKFRKLGGRMPTGVLLVGPPGVGKTLLARAVAGETNSAFFTVSGSDFVEMFVGVGAARVRDLFNEARKASPCIIFIDEIDAVGRHRGTGLGSGFDEREQTLNQLLVEMDGFEKSSGVIVLAATNRIDVLDPALLRPGRFDKSVMIFPPDIRGREEILAIHSKGKRMASNIDLTRVARGTPGFTGADLQSLVNESALRAVHEDRTEIIMDDLEWARDKIMMGPERKSMVLKPETKKVTAYHEAGHALVGAYLTNTDPVHKITIIPRGAAMGLTSFLPEIDRHSYDKEFLLNKIAVAMGGRAAEEIIFKQITTGAGNDIEQATHIADKMVTEWGMSEELGPLNLHSESDDPFVRELGNSSEYGEKIADKVDQEIQNILTTAYDQACTLLRENIEKLHRLAEMLIEKETVDGEELKTLISDPSL